MKYFSNSLFSSIEKNNNFLKGFSFLDKPMVGDVLKVYFSKKGYYYFFEGFCFSIKKKQFLNYNATISLINKLKGVYIFFFISFFINLIFSFEKLDFKKIKLSFRRAKVTSIKKINI